MTKGQALAAVVLIHLAISVAHGSAHTGAQVPLPLLGWLFKFRSNRTEKTNLLIFLTPTIVKNPKEMAELRAAKSETMTRHLDELSVGASGAQRALLDGINPPEPKE